MAKREEPTDLYISLPDDRVMSLDRLRKLAFNNRNATDVRSGIRWLSREQPAFATPTINHLLERMDRHFYKHWKSGAITASMVAIGPTGLSAVQRRRASQWHYAVEFLKAMQVPLRKCHDARTIELLTSLAKHPSMTVKRPAGYLLLNLDHAPPQATLRELMAEHAGVNPAAEILVGLDDAIAAGSFEAAGRSIDGPLSVYRGSIPITLTSRRYKRMIHQVAKEWELACEQLAVAVYGKVLLARKRETTMMNGMKPDFIVDDGFIQHTAETGAICFANLIIDAKSGAPPDQDMYAGHCRDLQYWLRHPGPQNKPTKLQNTLVHLLGPAKLIQLGREHGAREAMEEVGRLAGAEGDFRWRWMQTFLENDKPP